MLPASQLVMVLSQSSKTETQYQVAFSLNFLTDLEMSELAQHYWLQITLQKCANILK